MNKLTIASLEAAVQAVTLTQDTTQGMLLEKTLLSSVFSMVENKKDWRGPIEAKLNADLCEVSQEVIARAVEFFTSTTPSFTREGDYLIVAALGYRAGPAGDH
jgi:hypothetical protein